mmetsp:Transcript_5557/g.13918  ORF Transcript_5557/g.13918 Transcript_5557/m.13918 type:complete len:232 (+) Transcript_5557:2943-3638(+)
MANADDWRAGPGAECRTGDGGAAQSKQIVRPRPRQLRGTVRRRCRSPARERQLRDGSEQHEQQTERCGNRHHGTFRCSTVHGGAGCYRDKNVNGVRYGGCCFREHIRLASSDDRVVDTPFQPDGESERDFPSNATKIEARAKSPGLDATSSHNYETKFAGRAGKQKQHGGRRVRPGFCIEACALPRPMPSQGEWNRSVAISEPGVATQSRINGPAPGCVVACLRPGRRRLS